MKYDEFHYCRTCKIYYDKVKIRCVCGKVLAYRPRNKSKKELKRVE